MLWHERLAAGPGRRSHPPAPCSRSPRLSLADTAGAGLLEVPALANGRGLREAGVLPNAGPGLGADRRAGRA